MNQVPFSRIHYLFREFKWICSFPRVLTFCYVNWHWIHYSFFGNTMNSLSARKFTLNPLFSGKLLWIHYLLRDFSFNSLSFLRNHYEFAMKSLWNHYEITMNSLFVSRIHYLFREFTLNPLSFFRNHCEFTISFTLSLWKHYLLYDFTMNSLSFSWFHYEFTIYFGNSLWIHYLNTLPITFNT